MNTRTLLRGATALIFLILSPQGQALPSAVDPLNPSNGITDLFSATFDGALSPCVGSAQPYCPFFGGEPGSTRQIIVTPNPTRVINGVPLGISPTPTAGSFLDLTLAPDRSTVTLAGGVIALPVINLSIQTTTIVQATGAGIVFGPPGPAQPGALTPAGGGSTGGTVSLNANGQGEFLVTLAPLVTADFSTFSIVVGSNCAGPLCSVIPILTLDMVRYRLLIDYSPDFSTFTISYIGQTSNNSILTLTLNSGNPEIDVTDSVPSTTDLAVAFGAVTELTTKTETVTVTNQGLAPLIIGAIGAVNPLATPFGFANDTCSSVTLAPSSSCTIDVSFSPASAGAVPDETFDIPSNDASEPSVVLTLSGAGVSTPVSALAVTDSVAPSTDLQVPFGSVTTGAQANQSLTLTSTGNTPVQLGQIGVPAGLTAPFSITSDTCSNQALAPAATCTVGLRFQPTATGGFSGSLDIPSNNANAAIVSVTVSGTGTAVAVPEIVVTDEVSPTTDLLIPFGNVTENTVRDLTITVTNNGNANLIVGTVGQPNGLAIPFSKGADTCSGQTLAPAATCTVDVRYAPTDIVSSSDSLDIPSNDPDQPLVTVAVNGTGILLGQGGIGTPSPSGASTGFMAIDPVSILLLGAAGVWGWRRRRAQ